MAIASQKISERVPRRTAVELWYLQTEGVPVDVSMAELYTLSRIECVDQLMFNYVSGVLGKNPYNGKDVQYLRGRIGGFGVRIRRDNNANRVLITLKEPH